MRELSYFFLLALFIPLLTFSQTAENDLGELESDTNLEQAQDPSVEKEMDDFESELEDADTSSESKPAESNQAKPENLEDDLEKELDAEDEEISLDEEVQP